MARQDYEDYNSVLGENTEDYDREESGQRCTISQVILMLKIHEKQVQGRITNLQKTFIYDIFCRIIGYFGDLRKSKSIDKPRTDILERS